MYVCFYGIVSHYLQKYTKDIKEEHKVNSYRLRKDSRRGITFFSDIERYLIQGKVEIYNSVVITVLMK